MAGANWHGVVHTCIVLYCFVSLVVGIFHVMYERYIVDGVWHSNVCFLIGDVRTLLMACFTWYLCIICGLHLVPGVV